MTQWPLTVALMRQHAARAHAVEPVPPGRYEVVVVDDTTVEVTEGEFAGSRIKVPAGWQVPKELRTAQVDVAVKFVHPVEPPSGQSVFYRGWECGYDSDAAFWTPEGYAGYKGGVDLDAPQVHGKTWVELLEAIDDEEDE